ncbi:PD-(D/E)XK nuclease family protein [Paenibacillus sp. JX-17]|uniref:PD-(D/E)XK nuclease family protein n=1 Tax=Paenibacillus lacisoli TaxID=3064525 RepID=A0ABT9CE36_9BACL|nr:PD-(D/E)XK nuclease family protein [Paenibacillus sp. JX-17]MDO7907120.1 PD-(D/E)XK nuclease family protein [Paenibacillus sp. JX-17]
MAMYPQWSYSQSRANMFNECLRKYYYHYYGAHNGWSADKGTPEQVHIYRLKQMSNLYLVFGDLAHRMCESSIRQWDEHQSVPRLEFLAAAMKKQLNEAYQQSMQREAWQEHPRERVMLSEIYYEDERLDDRIALIRERQQACVEHLYTSQSWKDVTSRDCSILEIEKWDTMTLYDTKVYIKMDLLYRRSGGNLVIVDWKTGREDDFTDQLYLYAAYVQDKYNVPLEQIELRVEYLVSGEHQDYTVTREDIEAVENRVRYEIEEMKVCLADNYYNRPKEISFFTPMPSRRVCGECNYREICAYREV